MNKNLLKNVCITGAGNGIGRSIAVLMNLRGFNVACVDKDFYGLEITINKMTNHKCKKIAIKADISDIIKITPIIENTVENFGSIDILINNAGVYKSSDLMNLDEDDWDWMNNINAKASFFCLQAAAKQMIKQGKGGRIINMSSIGANGFVDVSNVIYAVTKGAILSMTRTASQELGKYNINVNSICPGPTYTKIVKKLVEDRAKKENKKEEEVLNYYMKDLPLKRFNEPEDIASLVIFLTSEGARNITGQSFNID